jgi:hypothetical protein
MFRWPPLWSSGQSSWLHNGDVLCFLWGTNWIYVCCVEGSRQPLWSSGQSSWLHNGDVLCFLWGTNWIYICYIEESRPPLRTSGQSSWLLNGDVLCFLWGMTWIYICYGEFWSSPNSFFLTLVLCLNKAFSSIKYSSIYQEQLVKCLVREFKWSNSHECSSEIDCASVLVKCFVRVF